MPDDAAARPPANARWRRKLSSHIRDGLRITKGDSWLRPPIWAQQRTPRGFEERFVEGHLFGGASGSLIEKQINSIKERHCKINSVLPSISQFWPSGQSHFRPWQNPHLAKGSAP